MNSFYSLLDDDNEESVRLPADIIQYIDEQRHDRNLSREDYVRAALRCYVASSHVSRPPSTAEPLIYT